LRQIGSLSDEQRARHLADHLLTLGVATQLRREADGWGLWVLDEDRIALARQELDQFRERPDDPRFHAASRAADTIRRDSQRREEEFRQNFRSVRDAWEGPNLRRRPLTFALIVACVVVYLLWSLPGTKNVVEEKLLFSVDRIEFIAGQPVLRHGDLDDILHGQVWRLVTPIFMHSRRNFLHILFNLWWLNALGTLIEVRRGTLRLLGLVLISAVVSNLGQYLWMERIDPGRPHFFLGMSGVVYALFGYVWMKGVYQPEQRMGVHPNTVNTLLIWLVVCMTGMIGPVANAAHFVGLVVGVVAGLMGF
jgi:GlpG protein